MYNLSVTNTSFDKADQVREARSCLNLIVRLFPFLLEDKAFLDKALWKEGEPSNAIKLMESVTLLLFMPGFTVNFCRDPILVHCKRHRLTCIAIDNHYIWKSGISFGVADNHSYNSYNANRILVLRMLLTCLS